MTGVSGVARDSAIRDTYYFEGSDADPRISSNERQVYNTFSSNYMNPNRTFGGSTGIMN